jgi:hypothetical protein
LAAPEVGPAPASAELLLAQGVQLRKEGDDAQALLKFRQAWSMTGSSQALAQAALAEQALGLWAAAHEHLSRALEAPASPWMVQNEAALRESLREVEAHVGRLQVDCNVTGAALTLDDQPLGLVPLEQPALVPAGQAILRASAPGYFTISRPVAIDAGGLTRVRIALTALEEEGEPATQVEGEGESQLLLYGSLALSATGIVVGTAGYAMREINVRLYNDDSRCDQEPSVGRSRECSAEYSAWRLGQTTAVVGFAGAAVFGGLGAYLWLSNSRAPDPATTGLACGAAWVGGGSASVGCSGRW